MKVFFKTILTIIICALAILIASQSITKIYRAPGVSPFQGDDFYNPYANLDSAAWSSGFMKANFHAHTRWDVNGSYTVDEFFDAYKFSKYNILAVADHNHITSTVSDTAVIAFAPTYEHGYNFNNFHKLMLSVADVDYIDVPLMFMPRQQMQYAIERLSSQPRALSINHPERVRMVPENVFGRLRGFSLMEINPDADARYWDQILTVGNYTTLIASDDAHSITNRNSWFQRAFTMVFTGSDNPSSDQIIEALQNGQAYGVVVSNERNAQGPHADFPSISGIKFNDTTLCVTLSGKAEKIAFMGNSGRLIGSFDNVAKAQIQILDDEPYVRVEVQMPDGVRFFTNPIVRSENGLKPAPLPLPESVLWLTILNIVGWNLLALLFLVIMLSIVWRKRAKRTNFENFMWGAGLKPYDPN